MSKELISEYFGDNNGKSAIFYSWFPTATPIESTVEDFYKFCIQNCNKNGLALDIGADMGEGLTQNILLNNWNDIIYCFDVWKKRKPEHINGTVFIEGDAIDQVTDFLQKQNNSIGIIEVDIRGLEKEMYHPSDLGLDFENNKTEAIIDACMDYVTNNSVIIIHEFHTRTFLNSDAYALARSFAKYNVKYECLCYGVNFPKSAWIIKNNKTSLYKDDLINLMNIIN